MYLFASLGPYWAPLGRQDACHWVKGVLGVEWWRGGEGGSGGKAGKGAQTRWWGPDAVAKAESWEVF